MKTLTSKKEARLEKKKKKSAALAQICKLNDHDEIIIMKKNNQLTINDGGDVYHHHHNVDTIKNTNYGKDKIKSKSNNGINEKDIELEPKCKKIKLELTGGEGEYDESKMVIESNKIDNSKNVEIQVKSSASINSNPSSSNEDKNDFNYMTEREAKQRRQERRGPKIRLKELGEYALLNTTNESRVPLLLTDIQHLIMSTLSGNKSPFAPNRWFHLEKENKLTQSLVLIIEGISLFHFLSYESNLKESSIIFDYKFEVIMPPYKDGCIIQELASVPITNSRKDELIEKYGSLEAAMQIVRDSTLLMTTIFPIDNQLLDSPVNVTFSRTKLLLSPLQMVEEGYPLPLNGALAKKYSSYIFTKDTYDVVQDSSPMFGVDCEMCRTAIGTHELTRISIVNENLQPVYETLVRPTNKIVDYLTQYSGITPEMMLNTTKTLKEVQNEVKKILPSDAILVGQSLNSDLHAMKMMHPYVIDTSVIYNLSGERRKKAKLQILAKRFLDEEIQVQNDGHDPLEDSRASMKLAQLKLLMGIEYGDEVLRLKRKTNQLQIGDNLLNHAIKKEKRVAIITSQEISSNLGKITYKEINNRKNDTKKDDQNNDGGMSSDDSIHFFKMGGNKASIRKTQEMINNYDLTISNLNIPAERLELSKIEKTIGNVDKWIGKLWESIAHRGLFIVIFGGSPGSSSGVAMVKIKKNQSGEIINTEIPVIT